MHVYVNYVYRMLRFFIEKNLKYFCFYFYMTSFFRKLLLLFTQVVFLQNTVTFTQVVLRAIHFNFISSTKTFTRLNVAYIYTYIKQCSDETLTRRISCGLSSLYSGDSVKLLCITVSNDLTRKRHVDNIVKKAGKIPGYMLYQLKQAGVNQADLVTIYISVVRPEVEYACTVHCTNLSIYLSENIEIIQKRALKATFPGMS